MKIVNHRISRIACLLFLIAATPLVAQTRRSENTAKPKPSDPGQIAVRQAESLSQAFRYASSKVLPAVVKISSRTAARRVRLSNGANPFGGEQYIPETGGTGSGVIISADGLILTNNHVVSGADEVTVQLDDGTEYKAFDVRTDPDSDLAVLRITANRQLPFARMGNSDQLEIGDWVLAIGHPFELESSVSAGIISAKGRSLGAAKRATFLQTDAAVNPGNSGGPLINLRGEIVGINTAIASRSGGFNGISFAIPINLAKWVSSQLVRDGEVHRAWLGVGASPLTTLTRSLAKVESSVHGVWVGEVHQGSPSDHGGLQPGDVITRVNKSNISDVTQLQRVVEKAPLDSTMSVEVIRKGRPVVLRIKAAAMPKQLRANTRLGFDQIDPNRVVRVNPFGLGELLMHEVDTRAAKQLGTAPGIRIYRSNNQAVRRGLESGAVITTVNGKSVTNFENFIDAIESVSVDEPLILNVEVPRVSRKLVVIEPLS